MNPKSIFCTKRLWTINMNFKVFKLWRWQTYNNWKQHVCAATYNAFISVFKALRNTLEPISFCFLDFMCSIILFPVIHCVRFSVKWCFHISYFPLMFSSLDKRKLRFLLTMPTSYFFLPQHARAKSAAHLSALFKPEETKPQHQNPFQAATQLSVHQYWICH